MSLRFARSLALGALVALAGCVTADNYADRFTRTWCQRAEECAKGEFEAAFTSQEDCLEETLDQNEVLEVCLTDECEFDKEAARSCLHDLASGSCDDFVNGDYGPDCDDVFTDCDSVGFAECLLDG